MPQGDAMRARFGDLMELVKRDNRGVIAAMLADRIEVPDTVGDLGLRYDPERKRSDSHGQPIMSIYGLRDMVSRGTFSCGDAAAYEAAVLEEKYGIRTLCIAVPQGEDELHGIFVIEDGAVDPTANFLSKTRSVMPQIHHAQVERSQCSIEHGRVICFEEDRCSVEEDGTWNCPDIPGLTGRRVALGPVRRTRTGQAWARTSDGSVVPVRRTLG